MGGKRFGLPYVFAVCGVKNSGKTTYIEKLIRALKEQGIRIAVIKHDGHDFEAETQETDTGRMYRAGADATIVFSAEQMLFHERRRRTLDSLVSMLSGYDLVLVEGCKESDLPKIELVREGNSSSAVSRGQGRIGVATDISGYRNEKQGEAVYPLDDVEPIVQELIQRIEQEARRAQAELYVRGEQNG